MLPQTSNLKPSNNSDQPTGIAGSDTTLSTPSPPSGTIRILMTSELAQPSDEREPVIEFQIRADLKDDVPRPYPAKSAIPDWYRNMPTEAATPGFSTVKRCPPFLDAMTAGYIIPVPTDITLSVHAGGSGGGGGGGGIDIEIANFRSPLV